MKFKYLALPLAIILVACALAVSGQRLKKNVIEPLELESYMDKSVFELPFLAKTDAELKFYIENADILLSSQPSTGGPEPEPSTGTTEGTEPEPSTGGTEGTEPEPTQPQPTVAPNPDGPTTEYPDGVEDSWFENTLFVGDSRMQGLSLCARSGNADYFCDVGLTVGTVMTNTVDGQTLKDVLSAKTYDKIIINLGLNEAGNGEYWFRSCVEKLVSTIRSAQPDAIIIFNAIMPVTREYIKNSPYGSSFTPEKLSSRSAIFAEYANGTDIFYIDCTPYFADSEGYLYSSITSDGCHPTATYYKVWERWMRYALSLLDI